MGVVVAIVVQLSDYIDAIQIIQTMWMLSRSGQSKAIWTWTGWILVGKVFYKLKLLFIVDCRGLIYIKFWMGLDPYGSFDTFFCPVTIWLGSAAF